MNKFSDMLGQSARLWYLIDGRDQVVGKIAQQAATILQGKHKPTFTRSVYVGDHVVITNTQHVVFTGKKWIQKKYRWHSGYASGFQEVLAKDLHKRNPTFVLHRAIYGSLPKNSLRPRRMKQLHLFPEERHPYKENISFVLPGPSEKRKQLSDYTEEDFMKVPVVVDPDKSFMLPEHEAFKGKLRAQYRKTLPKKYKPALAKKAESADA